jgi:hypothetical protein
MTIPLRAGRTLYHLMRADFLERVRRYSFFVTLLAIVAFTYLCLPALDTPAWLYLNVGRARPIYNSAWIGLAVTRLMAEFFPLFGFYLVKNALERDRRTGVGEIIATTPIRRPMYTLGKWFSNLAVFGAVIGVSVLAALVLQFLRAEEFTVDTWALVAPFLLLLLPELAFIAALAVLFESVSWLRGGFGNLAYYVVYGAAVVLGDLQGMTGVWPSVYQACSARFDGCRTGSRIDVGAPPLLDLPTFRYDGIPWTAEVLWPRLAWIVASVAVALFAAAFFHRFDPSRIGNTPFARVKQIVLGFILQPGEAKEPDLLDADPAPTAVVRASLAALGPAEMTARPSRLGPFVTLYARMCMAELRLALKGLRWPWYLGTAVIILSAIFVPLDIARLVVLPAAMVWPTLVWSWLGAREVRHRTAPIVFSLPFPLRRQLLVTWLVGVLIALAMASTVVMRLGWTGDWSAALAALIGVLFVPSLAVALGCWSGTSKLFQALYLFLWYLASVQGVVFVDFMGHFPQTVALGIPWIVAIVTLGLLIAAAFGRQHQLQS